MSECFSVLRFSSCRCLDGGDAALRMNHNLNAGRIVEYLALCECARYANSEAELVIMELAEMGDLYDSLIQDGAPRLYSANHARRLIAMAIEAMADLRQAGFLHRDLKAENLLFNQHGQMLLGDIGTFCKWARMLTRLKRKMACAHASQPCLAAAGTVWQMESAALTSSHSS